jgi:phosphorylcholine metabolism protein LicD
MPLKILNFGDWHLTKVEDVYKPERYLEASARILDGLNVKWCFSFGTALGLYRDKDFIPGDSDVDINVYCLPEEVVEIEEAFEKEYNLIRVVSDGRKYQVAFQGIEGYIIDLSFFYPIENKWVSRHEEGNFIDDIDTIGNLMDLYTKYGKYPVPEKIEEYLTVRYGDWQTPKYGLINSSITQ